MAVSMVNDFYTNSTFPVKNRRGLWSRDRISIFRNPLITFERIELSASNLVILVHTWKADPSCIWTTKWPLIGRGRGHMTQFHIIGSPYNLWMNWPICSFVCLFVSSCDVFSQQIPALIDSILMSRTDVSYPILVDGTLMRTGHKTTPKWAWPGSRDLISKSWKHNFVKNWAIRFKFGTLIEDAASLRRDHKTTPISLRGLGHVTEFQHFGTSLISYFGTNSATRFKFVTDMEDGPLLRIKHKMTPWECAAGVMWQNFKIAGPLLTFEWIGLSAWNLVYK